MNKIQAKAALRTAEKNLAVDPENPKLQLEVESAKATLEKLSEVNEEKQPEAPNAGEANPEAQKVGEENPEAPKAGEKNPEAPKAGEKKPAVSNPKKK